MKKKKLIIFVIIIALLIIGSIGYFLYNKNSSKNKQEDNYEAERTSSENKAEENKDDSSQLNENNNDNNTQPEENSDNKQEQENQTIKEDSATSSNKQPQYTEEQIATFSTKIYSKDSARQNNVKITCNTLNNTTIKNGSIFSFCNTIGPSTSAKGYQKADIFDKDGNKKKGLGRWKLSS